MGSPAYISRESLPNRATGRATGSRRPGMEGGLGDPRGKWVRPDLNRSRQHPKLVGFLVGGKAASPRTQTKLPHGPAKAVQGNGQ